MLKYFAFRNLTKNKTNYEIDFTLYNEGFFNEKYFENNILKHGIIYDLHSFFSSQIMLSLFDIVSIFKKTPYNINTDNCPFDELEFNYKFQFEEDEIEYIYSRLNGKLKNQSFYINGTCVCQHSIENLDDFEESNCIVDYLNIINNDIRKIANEFLEFVDGMLYVDLHKPFKKIGLQEYIPTLDTILKEGDTLKRLNMFLIANGFETMLDFQNQVLIEERTGLPWREVCSSGTVAGIQIFYWLEIIRNNSNSSFIYIHNFDNLLHTLTSCAIKELIDDLKCCQTILNFSHNTSIINWKKCTPESCYVIKNGEVGPMNKFVDKEFKIVHNIEKIFRTKVLQ